MNELFQMTLGISLIKNKKGSEAVPGCHVVRGDRHCYSEMTVCVTWDEVVIILKSFGACVFNAAKRDTDPVTCCLTTGILAERCIIWQLHHYTKNICCGYKNKVVQFCLCDRVVLETGSSHLILYFLVTSIFLQSSWFHFSLTLNKMLPYIPILIILSSVAG